MLRRPAAAVRGGDGAPVIVGGRRQVEELPRLEGELGGGSVRAERGQSRGLRGSRGGGGARPWRRLAGEAGRGWLGSGASPGREDSVPGVNRSRGRAEEGLDVRPGGGGGNGSGGGVGGTSSKRGSALALRKKGGKGEDDVELAGEV